MGQGLRGIRDNENTMISSGKNVLGFKVEAFAFGAGIMGIGGLYLLMVSDLLTLLHLNQCATFFIWSMLMVGGSGNNRGLFLELSNVGHMDFHSILTWFLSDANLRFVLLE
ncbi:MAG: hypothetical protein Ct9H90mP2_07180 [Dehalococcoidia bacterium]|nr:MAG: hypothetical protein Ct9H90mP2_07180 [Dehalococcoidia bacterium]